jgi:hypothetical protein
MIINSLKLGHLNQKKDINYWLYEELLCSLHPEIIESGKKDNKIEFDLKLQINGFVVEPELLLRLFNKIETYVDVEAQHIANEKLADALHEVDILHEVIREAEYKIREKFDIPKENE